MSKFQQRHYEAIAEVMRATHPGAMSATNRAVMQWHDTVKELTDVFRRDNIKFKPDKFQQACKPYYLNTATGYRDVKVT